MTSRPRQLLSLQVARAKGTLWRRALPAEEQRLLAAPRRSKTNFLFIGCPGAISQSQYFLYAYFRREIESELDLRVGYLSLERFKSSPQLCMPQVRLVGLQTWYDVDRDELVHLVEKARAQFPNARLVFFDSFAPTDIRLAPFLSGRVDAYVKKSLLVDRNQYLAPVFGDTNLSDYYGRLCHLQQTSLQPIVPPEFFSVLRLGPGFVSAPYLLPLFAGSAPTQATHARKYDLHARIGADGSPWYSAMRQEAEKAVASLTDFALPPSGKVGQGRFLREIHSSKITFSPFGYGEICWRDFEAIALGSLLIKPDMSHLETEPNVFIPHETYVPVRWDFSDLGEKVAYYLAHDRERDRIIQNAFRTTHEFVAERRYMGHLRFLLGE